MKHCILAVTLATVSALLPAGTPLTIVVDDDGPADYSSIQDALNNSNDGDTIIVMPGIYCENVRFTGKKIRLTSVFPDDPDIVTSTIIDGRQSDSVMTFRDGETGESVLSGVTITNGKSESGGGIVCWNASPRIEKCRIISNTALNRGGGLACDNSSAQILQCTISGNTSEQGGGLCCYSDGSPYVGWCSVTGNAAVHGGGISLLGGSTSPVIHHCVISNNVASYNAGGINCSDSHATIADCSIVNNDAYNAGGAFLVGSSLLENCTISSNVATWKGGGLCLRGNAPIVCKCYVSGNRTSAHHGGGGICCWGAGSAHIIDSIVQGNRAHHGGGMYAIEEASPNIRNCIIAGNYSQVNGSGVEFDYSGGTRIVSCAVVGNRTSDENGSAIYFTENSASNVDVINNIVSHNQGYGIYWKYTTDKLLAYNNVWGNTGGDYGGWAVPDVGSISADPLFVDNGQWNDKGTPEDLSDDLWVNGDYHLKSQAGRWDSQSQEWVYDEVTSPCIDAGEPSASWTEELYPHGMRVNMGAYGGTAEASMSLSRQGNIAELNNDGIVDLLDYAVMARGWGLAKPLLREDLNRDGLVDSSDLIQMAGYWLAGGYALVYCSHMDVSPNWSAEGQWEFGQPLGLGGASYGHPDPSAGYTGTNVCGINLGGDYDPAVGGPYYLTTGPLDCRHFRTVQVAFMSWLNIDSSDYAQCQFEISTNGADWTVLWNNTPDPITDSEWQEMEFDISKYADDNPTVYLRWGYQIIDRAYPYSGWNIDDVQLWGTL